MVVERLGEGMNMLSDRKGDLLRQVEFTEQHCLRLCERGGTKKGSRDWRYLFHLGSFLLLCANLIAERDSSKSASSSGQSMENPESMGNDQLSSE